MLYWRHISLAFSMLLNSGNGVRAGPPSYSRGTVSRGGSSVRRPGGHFPRLGGAPTSSGYSGYPSSYDYVGSALLFVCKHLCRSFILVHLGHDCICCMYEFLTKRVNLIIIEL
jgi:hypothetical protein